MKIENPINQNVSRGGKRAVQSRREQSSSQANTNQQTTQQFSGTTSNLREMSDALLIMHKAQTIVQQALTVSSRLQNIAIGSVSDGQENYEEIGRELQSINTSLAEFGGEVPSPPIQAQQTIERPEISSEVASMQQMTESRSVDQTEINRVYSRLQERSYSIDRSAGKISQSMGIGQTQAAEVSSLITQNPTQAMSAQGYISPERTSQLIG